MSAEKRQCTGRTYLLFSVVCLLSLFIEYLILQCEQFIYQKNYYKFTITESIVHWVLICVIWGMAGALMVYLSTRVYNFDILRRSAKPSVAGWIAAPILIVVSVSAKYVLWDGWKIILDFHNSGWFQFIFQYVYYLFEILIVMLAVVFAQEAGEKIFHTNRVPWGGILAALTWGLSHIITQGSVTIGIYYTLCSVLYGILYLAVRKNLYISYPLLVLMFLC